MSTEFKAVLVPVGKGWESSPLARRIDAVKAAREHGPGRYVIFQRTAGRLSWDADGLVTVEGKRRAARTGRAVILLALLASPLLANSGKAPRGWADQDRDCRNTRAEVLQAACGEVQWNPLGCVPVRVVCRDLYSGAEISTDSPAQALDVDHVLPAAVAWKRRTWTLAEWRIFYNDTRNLLPVRARTNAQKSDRMPHQWCPANRGARRLVAARLMETAERHGIYLTAPELEGLAYWRRGLCRPGAIIAGERR